MFFRNFISFKGGHLKVWDYYQHINSSPHFTSRVFFGKNSVWKDNPWKSNCTPEKEWNPNACDILFMEGVDWVRLNNITLDENIPVINLIQGFRHADPTDRRYQYLSRRAIRICVSKEVKTALELTGKVNGPIFTIPNGIDHNLIPKNIKKKPIDIIISGIKNKDFALKLKDLFSLKGFSVVCLIEDVPRELYLKKLASAKVSVLLPEKEIHEGFYLPALESMATKCITICPDCIGNRSFCIDKENCLIPQYEIKSIYKTTLKAIKMSKIKKDLIINEGIRTASSHSLEKEREKVIDILNNIDNLWKSTATR